MQMGKGIHVLTQEVFVITYDCDVLQEGRHFKNIDMTFGFLLAAIVTFNGQSAHHLTETGRSCQGQGEKSGYKRRRQNLSFVVLYC